MKLPFKEKIKKITGWKFWGYLAKIEPFWFLVLLGVIFFAWAGALFYRYILATPPVLPTQELKININLYNKVLGKLEARQINIQEGMAKSYPDVFR